MLSHDMITISFSEYFLYSTTHRFHHCIRHCFFVKSSSPKKRLCHIGGTIFFICSMTYASLFHIYDLMFSFSAKNISIDAAFILQQNGGLFFGFLCMGAFSVFSILIDYKKIKLSQPLRHALWLAVSVLFTLCTWYYIFIRVHPTDIDTGLILFLVDSLEDYMYLPFMYFVFVEGEYCKKRNAE